MTNDEKWVAVLSNDANYDGFFFYALKTTSIYCRPSCKSKVPKRENVLYFNIAEDAITSNFRPCKRCRPDLLNYQPIKDIAEKAKKLIDELFYEKYELNEKLRDIGVTQHRMVEIFKEQYGVSPLEYVNRLRLQEAKHLLIETDNEIIDIAHSVGFGSLSAFYRFFKIGTGNSPSLYRKQNAVN